MAKPGINVTGRPPLNQAGQWGSEQECFFDFNKAISIAMSIWNI